MEQKVKASSQRIDTLKTQIDNIGEPIQEAKQDTKNQEDTQDKENNEKDERTNMQKIDDRIGVLEFTIPKMHHEFSDKQRQLIDIEPKASETEQNYEIIKADSIIMESKLSTNKEKNKRLVSTIKEL